MPTQSLEQLISENMDLSDRLANVEQQLASAQHELAERQQTEAALRHSEQQLRTLYLKAHRQAQELNLLGQVRASLARELDLPAMFQTIVEAVARVFGYTHVSLYTLEQDTLILRHQVGYNSVIERVPLNSGISGRVIRNRQPLLIEDVRADLDFLGAIEGIVSQVCVPVFDDQCAMGVINVESNNGIRLSNEDLNLIIALAEHVGIAINRARLYGAVQHRVQELEALRATMTEISANLDLDTLLSSILERQVALLGATAGELCLYEPDSNMLQIVASHNLNPSPVGTWLALGEGLMGQVALNRTPIVVPNYHLWLNRVSIYEDIGPITALAVPMLAGEQLIGILGVGDTNVGRVFTADDLRLLSLFAQQATVAIQNARLFAETHHLAMIDPLTGLANRRAFYAMAHHAFEYAHRCGHCLSAIMLDVDDFKRVNDLYGHAVGDHVLHEIGQRCRETLRSMDVIGRYGGEELAVILPNTDQKAAYHVAERLRLVLAKPSSKEAVSITVSIGVATYEPYDSIDLDQLIDRADRAQYMAKHTGKNRVIVWNTVHTIPTKAPHTYTH